MPTIQEIQKAVTRLYDADIRDSDRVLKKLYEEFGDIPVEDLEKAFAALAEELEIVAGEEEEQVQTAQRILALIERAEKESGQAKMTTEDAVRFLAERGDEEAKTLLDSLNSPQRKTQEAEMEAAIEWHPQWHMEGTRFYSDDGCEDDTPEKLLTAYRRHKRNEKG